MNPKLTDAITSLIPLLYSSNVGYDTQFNPYTRDSNNDSRSELETKRISQLYANAEPWQKQITEIRDIIGSILFDNLVLIIAEYHIVDYIDHTFALKSRWNGITQFRVQTGLQCTECHHLHHNFWIVVSQCLNSPSGRDYTYRILCSRCLSVEFKSHEKFSQDCNPNGKDPIWINPYGEAIVNWGERLSIEFNGSGQLRPKNSTTLLRLLCIDNTCRILPMTYFSIKHHRDYTIEITHNDLSSLFE